MTAVVVTIGLAVFCVLQALYWFGRGRSSARANALLERLGGASSVQDVTLLKQVDESGSLRSSIHDMLRQAGEPEQIFPFLVKVINWALIGAVLGLVAGGSLVALSLGAIIGCILPLVRLNQRRRQRLVQIEKNLPEALQVLIISLKSGHAMPKAIATTADEMSGPLRSELQILADELRLGRSVEVGFLRLGQRLERLQTVRTFVVAVVVLQQTGGNMVEVLEQLVEALHEQSQYARKLAAMTAEGRMSARILCGLPPVFLGLTAMAAPDYVGGLLNAGAGIAILLVAITLYVSGVLWVRKLVDPGGGV
ncbi:MAG: type II secretion system F family protein [Myxococcota bacterium]|nr:type II secretion system F family protein [Myxococcota bacterium]